MNNQSKILKTSQGRVLLSQARDGKTREEPVQEESVTEAQADNPESQFQAEEDNPQAQSQAQEDSQGYQADGGTRHALR